MIAVLCAAAVLTGGFTEVFAESAAATTDGKLLPASVVQAGGELWGFIDLTGAFVIKPEYVFVGRFNEKGIAIAAKGANTYGICSVTFIDKSGKTVSGPYRAYIPAFDEGIAILNGNEGSSWVVNSAGKLVFTSSDYLYSFNSELIRFSRKMADGNVLYGFRDYSGKIVIPAKYKELYEYPLKEENSTWPAPYYDEKAKKYGYKAQDGNIAIKPVFNEAWNFSNGFAVVSVETSQYVHRYALINEKGEYVIKPEYSGISSLGEGLYAVGSGSEMSYMDWYLPKAIFNCKGEKLTDYIYYSVSSFEGDYASASDNTTSFFIDRTGKMVNELPRLKGIGTLTLKDDIIEASLDGGLQYMTKDGRVIWQKDEAVPLGSGIFARTVK